jgi:hypothetical protein
MKKFKLEKKNTIASGFIVPEEYFIDFSEKVLSQLPKQESKVVSFFNNRNIIYAVAAAVIIGLFIPFYNQISTTTVVLDANTIENHLTYQTDIDSYELISELEEEDINSIQSSLRLHDETIETILSKNPDLETLISE